MGQPISWQYALVWSPMAAKPAFTVYRQSSAGHRFLWAAVPAGEYGGSPTIDQVLEELYGGVLALMEATA